MSEALASGTRRTTCVMLHVACSAARAAQRQRTELDALRAELERSETARTQLHRQASHDDSHVQRTTHAFPNERLCGCRPMPWSCPTTGTEHAGLFARCCIASQLRLVLGVPQLIECSGVTGDSPEEVSVGSP